MLLGTAKQAVTDISLRRAQPAQPLIDIMIRVRVCFRRMVVLHACSHRNLHKFGLREFLFGEEGVLFPNQTKNTPLAIQTCLNAYVANTDGSYVIIFGLCCVQGVIQLLILIPCCAQ